MVAPQPADFDPQLAELIRRKVRRLIGHFGFTVSDVEDLEQELYMKTFPGMALHDPARTPRVAFAAGNVDRGIATIIEARNAPKRDWRRHRSLADDFELSDGDSIRRLITRIDVRDAVSSLPPDLQQWVGCFDKFDDAEIMAMTGQTRGKVRFMRQRLDKALAALRPE